MHEIKNINLKEMVKSYVIISNDVMSREGENYFGQLNTYFFSIRNYKKTGYVGIKGYLNFTDKAIDINNKHLFQENKKNIHLNINICKNDNEKNCRVNVEDGICISSYYFDITENELLKVFKEVKDIL